MPIFSNILAQLKKGNQLALRVLYDDFGASLYQLAFHILKDEEHAEEIVQDSYIQLWKNRAQLSDDSNLKALLFVICRNHSFNRLKIINRNRSRFVKFSVEELEQSYYLEENPLEEKDFLDLIESIVIRLPTKQQLVFRMSRFEGLSYQEIAEKLQISKYTVKNHLVAAIKFVKEQIQNNENQGYVYILIYFFLFK